MAQRRNQARNNGLRLRWAQLRESVKSQLWPVPTMATIAAVLAGLAVPAFDSAVDDNLPDSVRAFLFAGGPDSAREVLSAIAGSLITVTALTFSLTVVTFQLASSQFSPRLLRMFASDRIMHATLAIFLGTFTYALTVLRSVKSETSTTDELVPLIAVTLASLLTFVSVITLALFLGHLSRKIRVETMLRNVHDETIGTIALVGERTEADVEMVTPDARPDHTTTVAATTSGFITSVNSSRLVELACEHGLVIAEEHAVGSSVVAGVPLVSWWRADGATGPGVDDQAAFEHAVNAAFTLGYERTSSQDIAFGFRQLVDVASKALSPGINDPTTAVYALSHLSALLCAMTGLPEGRRGVVDENGVVRLIARPQNFGELVELAVEQPRRYGAGDPRLAARLFQLLREVGYSTRTEQQREVIRGQTERLTASIRRHDYDESERLRFAKLADNVAAALDGRWH
ncbi:MAG: DUF2254 domain-containing protein [Homoserinimonas sp.]